MAVIATCRGFNYKVSPVGSNSLGIYKVDGLDTGQGTNPILISGVSVQDDDITLPVITLESTRVLYTFGANFGEVMINGLILLGAAGKEGQGESFSKVVKFFKEKRVSSSKSSVNVSGPAGISWKVFLTGLMIRESDPQFNIQPFSLMGKIAEPK